VRLLADRDATIAEPARLIERLVGQAEQLSDRVAQLDRRLGQDSSNSSRLSSSDSPFAKKTARPRSSRTSTGRPKGKQAVRRGGDDPRDGR
jgi:transposase